MVGGGFGGSVIALADDDATDRIEAAVAARFAAGGDGPPRTFRAVPSDGARRLA
jgi:galactokinase